jgi:hypothetical protein
MTDGRTCDCCRNFVSTGCYEVTGSSSLFACDECGSTEDFQFDAPVDWKIKKPEHCKDFATQSTDSVPCLVRFVIGESDYKVRVFDCGVSDTIIGVCNAIIEEVPEIIEEFRNKSFNKPQKISSDATQLLVHDWYSNDGKMCFIILMETSINFHKLYLFQIFINIKMHTLCFSTIVSTIDTDCPLDSAFKRYPHIKDLYHYVIKSLK